MAPILASTAIVLSFALLRAAPLPLQGMQSMDDQTMADWVSANEGEEQLAARYESMAQVLKPGLRRYNAFWSAVEPSASFPPGSPPTCPSRSILAPASEADRVRLSYHRFHCYDAATILHFDDYLARDAAIGAASAFIVYGSPAWVAHPGCTGFPWGPTMYKSGCLPWGHLDDWEDYMNFITGRWNAPWGSGKARLSNLVIWNEVQSMGWADPSPILPNRYTGPGTWGPGDMATFAGMIANLTLRAGAAAARNFPDGGTMLWLSTDHFVTAPPLKQGDVFHLGLYDFLDAYWPLVNTTYDWGVAVHPYDAGDPRANLTAQGVYTFLTTRALVGDFQCAKLSSVAGVPPSECGQYPQTQMYASEQGWPFNNITMTKELQARNICLAHGLSLANGLWAVSHNFFQAPGPTSQGNAGDFSLCDFPPTVWGNLSNGCGHATFDAYAATAPGVYGVDATNYCCTAWGWGCPGGDPLPAGLDGARVSSGGA